MVKGWVVGEGVTGGRVAPIRHTRLYMLDAMSLDASPRLALDGVTLVMLFSWQQTADMWTMGLQTTSGSVIRERSAVPLTASGVDLWAPVQYDQRMPGGQLWIAWGDQRPRAPGREDWRGDARLYYRPRALVEAVRGTSLALY